MHENHINFLFKRVLKNTTHVFPATEFLQFQIQILSTILILRVTEVKSKKKGQIEEKT